MVITTVLAVAVGCSAILYGVFAADRSKQALPAGEQGSESSTVSDNGATGQAGEVSLQQPSGSDSDSTTAVSQDAGVSGDISEAGGVSEAGDVSEANDALAPAKDTNADRDRQAVAALVKDFGGKLQMVSLLAPKDLAAEGIKQNYGEYVTTELLQKWMADPQSAPGRMVSSPWPDRIDIFAIEAGGNDQYMVRGEIIEVTSVELANGGAAAKRPIVLTVRKIGDRWLISDVSLGEYAKRGPVKYENKKYGFDFYLPKSWKGYTVIEEKWEGRNGGDLIETGPQLLIRNPAWTKEKPYQDIPIMIFTNEQWNALQNEKFFVSAAPVGPSVLGRNSEYVFALPPRYNFAFPAGYEEVEKILGGSPLWPFTPKPDNC